MIVRKVLSILTWTHLLVSDRSFEVKLAWFICDKRQEIDFAVDCLKDNTYTFTRTLHTGVCTLQLNRIDLLHFLWVEIKHALSEGNWWRSREYFLANAERSLNSAKP